MRRRREEERRGNERGEGERKVEWRIEGGGWDVGSGGKGDEGGGGRVEE